MDKIEALIIGQDRANKDKKPYYLHQSKNGQWTSESVEWSESSVGRLITGNKKKILILPEKQT